MTDRALNQKYNAMYAQLRAWNDEGKQVCSKWYADFCRIADLDYEVNRSLYLSVR